MAQPRRPSPAFVATLLASFLAACGAPATRTPATFAPITLSFPPTAQARGARVDDLRPLAEAVKGSYVRVLILAPGEASADARAESATGIVNGASGTVVDDRGHVVTAAHIALGTRYRAEITTIDGRVHPARIVHVDRKRELALLEMTPVPALARPRFADSRQLVAGEPVLAIGTPINRKGVVSVGEVERPRWPGRVQYGRFGFDDAIALHLRIAPGHSGGPVFNARGELIGIVGSFALPAGRRPRSAPPLDLAFAIPANAVAAFVEEVLARRR